MGGDPESPPCDAGCPPHFRLRRQTERVTFRDHSPEWANPCPRPAADAWSVSPVTVHRRRVSEEAAAVVSTIWPHDMVEAGPLTRRAEGTASAGQEDEQGLRFEKVAPAQTRASELLCPSGEHRIA